MTALTLQTGLRLALGMEGPIAQNITAFALFLENTECCVGIIWQNDCCEILNQRVVVRDALETRGVVLRDTGKHNSCTGEIQVYYLAEFHHLNHSYNYHSPPVS